MTRIPKITSNFPMMRESWLPDAPSSGCPEQGRSLLPHDPLDGQVEDHLRYVAGVFGDALLRVDQRVDGVVGLYVLLVEGPHQVVRRLAETLGLLHHHI